MNTLILPEVKSETELRFYCCFSNFWTDNEKKSYILAFNLKKVVASTTAFWTPGSSSTEWKVQAVESKVFVEWMNYTVDGNMFGDIKGDKAYYVSATS